MQTTVSCVNKTELRVSRCLCAKNTFICKCARAAALGFLYKIISQQSLSITQSHVCFVHSPPTTLSFIHATDQPANQRAASRIYFGAFSMFCILVIYINYMNEYIYKSMCMLFRLKSHTIIFSYFITYQLIEWLSDWPKEQNAIFVIFCFYFAFRRRRRARALFLSHSRNKSNHSV